MWPNAVDDRALRTFSLDLALEFTSATWGTEGKSPVQDDPEQLGGWVNWDG